MPHPPARVLVQRKRTAKDRGARSRIVDDLTADAFRQVARAWSRVESDGALSGQFPAVAATA